METKDKIPLDELVLKKTYALIQVTKFSITKIAQIPIHPKTKILFIIREFLYFNIFYYITSFPFFKLKLEKS
jgi:hypothetical protein